MNDLYETNWCEKLVDGDTAIRKENGKEIPVVLLDALRRLSREAGIREQSCTVQTHIVGNQFLVQCIYSAVFPGEISFVGTADCSKANTEGDFAKYPTAVAESRAEARCLKKALGIKMLSAEEIGFNNVMASMEISSNKKIESQVVKTIESLCDSRGIDQATVIESVITDSDRAMSIFDLSELTLDEGRAMVAWLNDQKPSSKTQRDARKKELENKAK